MNNEDFWFSKFKFSHKNNYVTLSIKDLSFFVFLLIDVQVIDSIEKV